MLGDRFRISSSLRRIIANAGWLFVLRLLRIGFALFVTVWLARYLGPERFGSLNYAIAFVALFVPVARLGLADIVVREVVRHPADRERVLGTTFLLKLLGGGCCLLLVAAVISLVRPGDTLMLALTGFIALGVVFQAFDSIDIWFQSQVRSKYSVIAKSVALMLSSLGKIVLILAGAPLVAFAGVLALESIMAALGLVLVYRFRGNRLAAWRYSLACARELLRESWPMILTSTLAVLYLRIDQVMLGEILGEREVGIYSTAVRISEVWYFVPMAVTASVFPALIKSKQMGREVYEHRLQQLFDFLASVALVVAIVMTFAANPLVNLLFGRQYTGAGPVLAVHIWGGIFVFTRWGLGKWLINEGLVRFLFVIHGAGVVVNVLLNIYLIPRYGGLGAAAASVVSYIVSGYLACFIRAETRPAAVMISRALIAPLRALAGIGRAGGGADG